MLDLPIVLGLHNIELTDECVYYQKHWLPKEDFNLITHRKKPHITEIHIRTNIVFSITLFIVSPIFLVHHICGIFGEK